MKIKFTRSNYKRAKSFSERDENKFKELAIHKLVFRNTPYEYKNNFEQVPIINNNLLKWLYFY